MKDFKKQAGALLFAAYLLCTCSGVAAQQYNIVIDNALDLDPSQSHNIEAKQSILFKVRDTDPNISAHYYPDPDKSMLAHITGSPPVVTTSYLPFPAGAYTVDPNLPVGAINAAIDVSPTGAATYNVPVFVAPGIAGMQPQLSVVYNSQGGNGLLGIGWELAGLSAITRLPQTIYHEGGSYVPGINLTGSDRFALDGNRLMLMSGTYGANNSVYHTELETYSKIDAHGSGPVYFTVTTKDGNVIEYGNTDDSRVEPSGYGLPPVNWRINKVTDLNGNFIKYFYKEVVGEAVIDKIEYTGNDAAGTTPVNIIMFFYENRADRNTFYVVGERTEQTKILKKMRCISDGKLVRELQFEYAYDNFFSHLVKITEFGSDMSKLNSTVVYWGGVMPSSNIVSTSVSSYIVNAKMISGDFNGDGKTDLFTYNGNPVGGEYYSGDSYVIYQSNGDGTFANVFSHSYDHDYFRPDLTCVGDLNADGFADILLVFYNDGNEEFEFVTVWGSSSSLSQSIGIAFVCNVDLFNSLRTINTAIADFDGNGINDIIISDQIAGYLGMPIRTAFLIKSFLSGSWTNIFTKPYENNIYSFDLVDFNGNGKADILIRYLDDVLPGSTSKIIEISTANNFNQIYPPAGSTTGFPTQWHRLYPGDFNGDGKTDLLSFTNNGSGIYSWHLNYSTGTSFTVEADPPLNSTNPTNVEYSCIVRDYNGDGKDDIFEAYTSPTPTCHVHLGTNAGAFQTENVNLVPGLNGLFFVSFSSPLTFSDYNGDGKEDVFCKPYGASNFSTIFFHKDEQRNLVQSFTNGFNLTTKFSYSPITNNNVYTKGSGAAFPINDFQGPMYVVSETKIPDGLGGELTTNYTYEEARLHRHGKGFLGFETVTADNVTTGWKTINHYSLFEVFMFPVLDLTETFKNGNLVSETDYDNNLSWSIYHPECFNYSSLDIYEFDILRNTHKINYTTFDFKRNVFPAVHFKTGTNTFSDVIRLTAPVYADVIVVNSHPIQKITHSGNNQTYYQKPVFSSPVDFTYYPNGNLKDEITFPGTANEVTTHYEYFSCGLPQFVTVSASGLSSKTTEYQYDNNFLFPVKIIDPAGDFITREYFHDGNIKTETSIDNLKTTFRYDGFGRLIKTFTPQGHLITSTMQWSNGSGPPHALYFIINSAPGKPNVKTYYDALGRELRTETDGFNGMLTVEKHYNFKGQRTEESKPSYGTPTKWTTYGYDNYDRPITVTYNGHTITTTYSNLTITTDDVQNPALHSVKTFNSAGNLLSSTDNGGTVSYTYHSSGKPLTITAAGATTTLHYDPYGRQDELHDPDAGLMTYVYNAFGELQSQTDANIKTYTFAYNMLGQPLTKTCSDGTVYTYTYVVSGYGKRKLLSATCSNGTSQSYQYDQYGRITQFTDAMTGKSMVTNYEYDVYGNLTKHTYPSSGFSVTNNYDSKGYLTSITNNTNNSAIWTLNNENAYGQPLDYTFGNGLTTYFSYNSYDYLQNITTGSLQNMNYNFSSFTGNLENRSRSYSGNTLSDDFISPNPYDNLNRLRGYTTNTGQTVTVTMDGNGNITSKSDAGDPYSYGDNGAGPHAVTGVIPTAGSVISPDEQFITYTPFNKVQQVSENGKTIDFTYGPDQERIKTVYTDGSVTKTKYFSADYEEVEIAGQPIRKYYITGSHGLAAIYIDDGTTQQMYYVLKDHLGSITGLVDQSGNLAQEYSFDAWGRRRNPATGAYLTSFTGLIDRGFTRHEHLDEFGLINMNGRCYDPVLGRMLSPDNFVQAPDFTQAFNRYTYANNNPLSYVDPDGNNPLAAIMIFAAFTNVTIHSNNIRDIGDFVSFGVAGALSGAAGYGAGVAAVGAAGVGSVGFQAGLIGGAAGGAAGGFTGGSLNTWATGGTFSAGISAGLIEGAFGAIIGGAMGGLMGGLDAVSHGGDFWNGNGYTTDYALPTSQTGEIQVGEGMEYSNEYAAQFSDDNFVKDVPGLNNLCADNSTPDGLGYRIDPNGRVFNAKGEPVGASTQYISKVSGSDVFLYKSSFTSKQNLYITMGHEYIHVSLYNAGLMNHNKQEYAAYSWQQAQMKRLGMIGPNSYLKTDYLNIKNYSSLYNYKKFMLVPFIKKIY